jgi:anti-anti-sigma factor
MASRTASQLGTPIVLTPTEGLLAGGSAEAFERELQDLFRRGYRHLAVDLSAAPSIDSAGVRALVRGHSTARRQKATFRLVSPAPVVLEVLQRSKLADVFEIVSSVDVARAKPFPVQDIAVAAAGVALCVGLVWIGHVFPPTFSIPAAPGDAANGALPSAEPEPWASLVVLAKLAAAGLIGMLVTTIHEPTASEHVPSRSLAQSQVLLCVAGALMMLIIGNSLARAFGVAGAASIVRFRTPVDDPKDATTLFILMALGMSVGLGTFAVAGFGTAFLCLMLVWFGRASRRAARRINVEVVVAEGQLLPSRQVEEVLARNQVIFEPQEISQGKRPTVKYQTWMDPRTSLDDLSQQLMRDATGVIEVSWQHPKR